MANLNQNVNLFGGANVKAPVHGDSSRRHPAVDAKVKQLNAVGLLLVLAAVAFLLLFAVEPARAAYTGEIKMTPKLFTVGGDLEITVTDKDLDTNSNLKETVTVEVKHELTSEREKVTLEETEVDSGEFKGKLKTKREYSSGTSNDGIMYVVHDDVLEVTYTDALTFDNLTNVGMKATAKATENEITPGVTGIIEMESEFTAGGDLDITVTDKDLDTNSSSKESFKIKVVNIDTDELERVTLEETEIDSGKFKGTLQTTYSTGRGGDKNGSMNVQYGATLEVTYIDALTSESTTDVERKATAIARADVVGKIEMRPDPFIVGDTVNPLTIRVTDANFNTDGTAKDTVWVDVKNENTDGTEELELTETEISSGIFEAPLATNLGDVPDTSTSDRKMNANHGHVLTASYDSGGETDIFTTAKALVGVIGKVDMTPDPFVTGKLLTITVTDKDLDTDDTLAETFSEVVVKNNESNEFEYVTLEETGPATGEFKGTLQTNHSGDTGDDEDDIMNVQFGDTLKVTYIDAVTDGDDRNVERTATAKAEGGVTGTIDTKPKPFFKVGGDLIITVTDLDLVGSQTVDVTVTNETETETETVTLDVADAVTGKFEGALETTPGSDAGTNEDGKMNVNYGDVLTVTYIDAINSSLKVNSETTATATAEDRTPGVTGKIELTPNSPNLLIVETTLTIKVTDADIAGSGEVVVEVTTNRYKDDEREEVTLTEDDNNPGVFVGTIDTTSGDAFDTNPGDGKMNVKPGDRVTVTYKDSQDDDGNLADVRAAVKVGGGTTGELRFGPPLFTIGDIVNPLIITVKDKDLIGSQTVEVEVTTSNTTHGGSETVVLTESSSIPGTFEGQLNTKLGDAFDGETGNGSMNVEPGDVLTVTYEDQQNNGGALQPIKATAEAQGGVNGEIVMTPDPFTIGESLIITVTDADLDTDDGTPQTVSVEVTTDEHGESEAVTLTETGNDTGVFEGMLMTTYGTGAGTDNDGTMNVNVDDMLTATYADQLTSGGETEDFTATATAQIDEQYVSDRTSRIIHNYMVRRGDVITAGRPDLSDRLDEPLTASYGLTADMTDSKSTFKFNYGLSLRDLAQYGMAGPDGAAPAGGGGGDAAIASSRFDMWTTGSYSWSRDDTAESESLLGFLGADYRVTENLLIGLLGQFDWTKETNDTDKYEVSGYGWMAGPYVVARAPGQNLIFDARLAMGASYNDITPFTEQTARYQGPIYTDDFDTTRWLASAQVTGRYETGRMTVLPHLGVIYFEETQDAYTDSNGIEFSSQTISLGRMTFGPKITGEMESDSGWKLSPHVSLTGIWDFAGDETVNLTTGIGTGDEELRARVEAGVDVNYCGPGGPTFAASGFYDGIGRDSYEAYGGKLRLNVPF